MTPVGLTSREGTADAARLLRLAGLLLLLAGVLGMHGLAGHGMENMPMSSASMAAAVHGDMAGAQDPPGEGTTPPSRLAVMPSDQVEPPTGSGSRGGAMCLAMICVAVLGAAMGALVCRSQRLSALWTERRRLLAVARPIRHFAGLGPPLSRSPFLLRC